MRLQIRGNPTPEDEEAVAAAFAVLAERLAPIPFPTGLPAGLAAWRRQRRTALAAAPRRERGSGPGRGTGG